MSLPTPKLPESMKGLVAPPKLHLYTAGTPNGYKVSVLLEELVLAYPSLKHSDLSYDTVFLNFDDKQQLTPEFKAINPNGRIPALIDDNHGGHRVFESANVLLWLVENYDKEYRFWFKDPIERSTALTWIFFIQGGVGPMQGQANHFVRYAPEKIPYGVKRYTDETKRLYGVLEGQLNAGKGEWLVGDKFSIVDINAFGWVRRHAWAGVPVEEMKPFPKLRAWLERIETRPGAYSGLGIPERKKADKHLTEEEVAEEVKKTSKWVMEGQPK